VKRRALLRHHLERRAAPDGRYIMVVFEQLDETTVYPAAAFDIEE
jgi:hypothetical protein